MGGDVATWIAIGSACGSVIGVSVAIYSAALSRAALQDARRAVTDRLWATHLENLHHLISLDPAREPVGDALVRVRVSGFALADRLPDWKRLEEWFGAEQVLVSTLGREVLEVSTPQDTPDRRFELLRPVADWGAAHIINLRALRRDGYKPEAVESLIELAGGATRGIYAKHGWEAPEQPVFRHLDEAVEELRSRAQGG